jgi:hypothetical protein
MLMANIGGICNLGKFWERDLAFILKKQGVCVILLGILCSKSKSLLKSRGLFGVTRFFVDGGSEPRCYSLGKLVLARGNFGGESEHKG